MIHDQDLYLVHRHIPRQICIVFILRNIKKSFIIRDMNTIISQQNKGSLKPAALSDWLISRGVTSITTEECAYLLGVPATEVPQRLAGLRRKGQLVSVARGLWIPVSAEYREMGAPEPIQYIHRLMDFYGCEYCLGWLTAASVLGASHQAPQVFQVATERVLRSRSVGRSEIRFYNRSYVRSVSKKRVSLVTGSAFVTTPGATMLMAASDLSLCAGIDNAATVICELAEEHPGFMNDVLKDAPLFSNASVHRLGWILDHIAGISDMDELADYCDRAQEPTILSPGGGRTGTIDNKWHVIENRRVEADI